MSKCNTSCVGSNSSLKIGVNHRQGKAGGQGGTAANTVLHGFFEAAKKLLGRPATSAAVEPFAAAHPTRLEAHEVWSGATRSPARISCESGTLWVTRQNDPNDYIVRAGEEMMAPHSPHLVISAMGGQPSIFRIQTPGSK